MTPPVNRRTNHRTDNGATDPILVIAAIAVSLILLVSGSFAVAKLIDNGKDLNAKDDLHKVAVAETATRAVATQSGDGKPGTKWTGTPNASASTFGSRTNYAQYSGGNLLPLPAGSAGVSQTRPFGTGGGTYSVVTGATDGPTDSGLTTYVRKAWTKAQPATNGSGLELTNSVNAASNFPVTAGDTWTISAYLRPSQTHTDGWIWLRFYNSGGSAVASPAAAKTTITAGQWNRLSLTATVPANVVRMMVTADVGPASGWAVGDTLDGTGVLFEKSSTLDTFFNGDTSPAKPESKGYVPYLTDSTATALNTNLLPTGGAVAGTALANGDIRFTQSDGTRVAVLTDPAGSAWAAVAKSTTGTLFLRTSESSRVTALGGATGARTIPTGFPLPDTITAADINAALSNAGSI